MRTIFLVIVGLIIFAMINTEITLKPFSVKLDFDWYYLGGWISIIIGLTLLMASSYNDGQRDMLKDVQEKIDEIVNKREDEPTELQELEGDSTPAQTPEVRA